MYVDGPLLGPERFWNGVNPGPARALQMRTPIWIGFEGDNMQAVVVDFCPWSFEAAPRPSVDIDERLRRDQFRELC